MTKKELAILAQVEELRSYLIRMYANCMSDNDNKLSDGEWLSNFLGMTKSVYFALGQVATLITGEG